MLSELRRLRQLLERHPRLDGGLWWAHLGGFFMNVHKLLENTLFECELYLGHALLSGDKEVRRLAEPAGLARLESRWWRAHTPRGASCAPARATAVVSRPLGFAVGRACEGAGEESVRACLNVGGFAVCVHSNRRL